MFNVQSSLLSTLYKMYKEQPVSYTEPTKADQGALLTDLIKYKASFTALQYFVLLTDIPVSKVNLPIPPCKLAISALGIQPRTSHCHPYGYPLSFNQAPPPSCVRSLLKQCSNCYKAPKRVRLR